MGLDLYSVSPLWSLHIILWALTGLRSRAAVSGFVQTCVFV